MEYVYAMTWAEFRIRSFAWKRKQDADLLKLRELAWVTYIAPHQNPKKMKKTIEQFWSLKKKRKTVIDNDMMALIKSEQEDYFAKIKELENG